MSALERVGREHGSYFTADQLLGTEFPDPRWAIYGLIPEGLTLLAGAPKLGKSWLSLGLGIAIASGGRALGKIDATEGAALYCALEDTPRRLKSRLEKLLGGEPGPAGLSIVTALPEMPRAIDLIAEWLDEHPTARLVVVDVLGKIRPPAGASADRYENDYKVVGALKRLADNYSVAIVAVTHTRKMGAEDPFDTVSGSTGLTGAADTTVVLRRGRGEAGATLHVTGRDVEESEYALTFDATTGSWELDGSALSEAASRAAEKRTTTGLDERSRSIVQLIGENPGGLRAADVATMAGIDADQARVYLSRLFKAERIEKAGPGLYTPVTAVSPVASPLASRNTETVATPKRGCSECGEPLDPFLAGQGFASHPMCEAEVAS